MESSKDLTAIQRIRFVLLLLALTGSCLLALTWDLRPFPLSAGVDDGRYVLSADYIRDLPGKLISGVRPLDWLGPYEPTTLFKRPGISMLLAAFSSLHLPFLQTVLILYLAGLAILANGLLKLRYSRPVVAVLVFVCGLLPTLYDSNGVRVLREVATGGLELAIFGICLSLFALETASPTSVLRSLRFIVLLTLLALHWTIREEAILLLPAVTILVLAALWLCQGSNRQKAFLSGVAILLILVPSQLAYVGIATLNRASYGLFLVNELSEGAFPRAVSALKRVDESPCDHTLLSRDEVDKVMAVSPSFHVVGDSVGLALTRRPGMIYTDAFSVMRVAALREKKVGWSPAGTQELFNAIASEVETACSSGRLRCAERQSGGVVPLLCGAQWAMVPANFIGYVLEHIVTVRHSGFNAWSYEMPSIDRLHPETLARFERITSQKMAGRSDKGAEFSQPAPIDILVRQEQWRSTMGRVYERTLPWMFGLGAIAILTRGRHWRDPKRPWWPIVVLALGVHVLCRATVFSYLSTVDGYLNTRYISVCYPVAAAFAVLAAAELRYFLPYDGRVALAGLRLIQIRDSVAVGVAAAIALLVVSGFLYAGTRSGQVPVAVSNANGPQGMLVVEGQHEFIDLDGRRIPLLAEKQGWLYAEAGWLRGNFAVFDGWATDAAGPGPAKIILLFADGRLIATATPTFSVPEVEAGFSPDEHAGFMIAVPHAEVAKRRVRIFALHEGDRAGELFYPERYLYHGEN